MAGAAASMVAVAAAVLVVLEGLAGKTAVVEVVLAEGMAVGAVKDVVDLARAAAHEI